MPSAAYELFLSAMRGRKQVSCIYQGHPREVCPILLGRTGLEEKSLVFQFGGRTSEGPIKQGGDWKCFRLAEVADVALHDGQWHSGGRHSAAQHCVKTVEYDVNPDSPYDPVFRF
jgi:hypothetical protein